MVGKASSLKHWKNREPSLNSPGFPRVLPVVAASDRRQNKIGAYAKGVQVCQFEGEVSTQSAPRDNTILRRISQFHYWDSKHKSIPTWEITKALTATSTLRWHWLLTSCCGVPLASAVPLISEAIDLDVLVYFLIHAAGCDGTLAGICRLRRGPSVEKVSMAQKKI
ncbi:hypothetical protein CA51_25220 [Rosistilla oblonga]|nr:hypothetical protein CA51_25220 [Rosistilla oblonga]